MVEVHCGKNQLRKLSTQIVLTTTLANVTPQKNVIARKVVLEIRNSAKLLYFSLHIEMGKKYRN